MWSWMRTSKRNKFPNAKTNFSILYVKKTITRQYMILKAENDVETGNDAQTGITKEESDEDYLEGSNEKDSDEEFEYSAHSPKVKWNKMRPTLGERYEPPHELKLCLTNYVVSKGFQIRLKKCDSVRLVAICDIPIFMARKDRFCLRFV
uniref:Transposase MuDR plant domain-containing protein n=1 Tax=Lactuca sativa TaxID=4236 RepID=A0A9R1VA55_LACSA|nr:hypothetical protein LSAT_V11C500236770 [Lactuca sativa]